MFFLNCPGGRLRWHPAVMRNTGTESRQHERIGSVTLPRSDWSSLTAEEFDLLAQEHRGLMPGAVTVLDLGSHHRDKWIRRRERLHELLQAPASPAVREESNQIVAALTELAVNIARQHHALRLVRVLKSRVAVHNQPLLSTGYNVHSGAYMGLHRDWLASTDPAEQDSFFLMGVNLGRAERYFCFLRETMDDCDPMAAERDAEGVTRAALFLRQHPELPVYRVEIRPFEAYVAQTARIIHDGMTSTRGSPDIALFIACDSREGNRP